MFKRTREFIHTLIYGHECIISKKGLMELTDNLDLLEYQAEIAITKYKLIEEELKIYLKVNRLRANRADYQ